MNPDFLRSDFACAPLFAKKNFGTRKLEKEIIWKFHFLHVVTTTKILTKLQEE